MEDPSPNPSPVVDATEAVFLVANVALIQYLQDSGAINVVNNAVLLLRFANCLHYITSVYDKTQPCSTVHAYDIQQSGFCQTR